MVLHLYHMDVHVDNIHPDWSTSTRPLICLDHARVTKMGKNDNKTLFSIISVTPAEIKAS